MKIGEIDFGERPVFLAPMEDVTDPAFRLLCKRFGADMVYTEFVSSDALIREVNRSPSVMRSVLWLSRFTVRIPMQWWVPQRW